MNASPERSSISSPSRTPDYFNVTKGYETIHVGHIGKSYTVVNDDTYDYYVLAGIEENELFSKLVMMNMNIRSGCAFDENIHKISHHFPDHMKVVNKSVSYQSDMRRDNLGYFIDKYNDMFLKMNLQGQEYLWILSLPSEALTKFKQMVIVFHDINNNPTKQRAVNKINCFRRLVETHDIAHIVPNGADLVVTYIRKDRMPTKDKTENVTLEYEQEEEVMSECEELPEDAAIEEEPQDEKVEKAEEIDEKTEEKVEEIEEKAEKAEEKVDEKAEEKAEEFEEKTEEKVDEKAEEIEEKVDEFEKKVEEKVIEKADKKAGKKVDEKAEEI